MVPLPEKQNVVGVEISTTSYSQVSQICCDWAQIHQEWIRAGAIPSTSPKGHSIAVTSVHGIVTAVLDRSFRNCLNSSDLATPDGMPVVWALRSFGYKGQQRVYGPDLTMFLCEMAVRSDVSLFLYGSRHEILLKLEQKLTTRLPGLRISGSLAPPFRALTAEESNEIVELIKKSQADIVLVGLSTPKQERWMQAHRERLPGVTLIGVGAAFDFHAGTLRQAPAWMQAAGLEWLFRLLMEPFRLWKRYLLITPLFLPLWGLQRIGLLRYVPGFASPGKEGLG